MMMKLNNLKDILAYIKKIYKKFIIFKECNVKKKVFEM